MRDTCPHVRVLRPQSTDSIHICPSGGFIPMLDLPAQWQKQNWSLLQLWLLTLALNKPGSPALLSTNANAHMNHEASVGVPWFMSNTCNPRPATLTLVVLQYGHYEATCQGHQHENMHLMPSWIRIGSAMSTSAAGTNIRWSKLLQTGWCFFLSMWIKFVLIHLSQ
jgi:hypothetical protein